MSTALSEPVAVTAAVSVPAPVAEPAPTAAAGFVPVAVAGFVPTPVAVAVPVRTGGRSGVAGPGLGSSQASGRARPRGGSGLGADQASGRIRPEGPETQSPGVGRQYRSEWAEWARKTGRTKES
ncbi:hypothetical protein GCM10010361_39630 [Streptomyces olivaceiscleroticus]|uniref:Uncharacterized protein n=1 Tax=Streptomyces olivaceiscleroticus TaxID=68245 RepID=A0ABP3K692_9ACTN